MPQNKIAARINNSALKIWKRVRSCVSTANSSCCTIIANKVPMVNKAILPIINKFIIVFSLSFAVIFYFIKKYVRN